MVGQGHVVRALTNALDQDRVHHAFLFTGTRGVGKTTVARIFAKALNCLEGVSSEPCGVCDNCKAIDEGRFVDLIEVDAASRTKVEDTRELLDNVQYAPSVGSYKVYLIDEVHMLSASSFNALLKTLEEPPPHIKFLLATTDPQKLPVTVLSRCLQFSLKRLAPRMISDYLEDILKQEQIEFDADALFRLAQAADGSMRDALSLLDQAIAFGAGEVRTDQVNNMLGTLNQTHLVALLDALHSADGAAVLATIEAMAADAPDFEEVLADLLSLLQRVAVVQQVAEAASEDWELFEEIKRFAATLAREDVQLYYQIALNGRRDLPLAPDPRGGFEMILLRMLAFQPAAFVGRGGTTPAQKQVSQAGVPQSARQAISQGSSQAGSQPAFNETAAPPTRQRPNAAEPSRPAAPASSTAASSAASVTPADPANQEWQALIEQAGVVGMAKELAANTQLIERDGSRFELALSPGHAHIASDSIRSKLEASLSRHLGESIKVNLVTRDPTVETLSQRQNRETAERQQAAQNSIESDPAVQGLMNTFGATIEPGSVKPH